MDSNSPGRNPRRFFLRRSTSCGNYERFKRSDSQDEMQKGVFSISSPRKGIRRLSTKDSTTAMAKAKSRKVLLISNPRMPHQRCSLSDSTTAMAKAKVLNNGVPLMKKSEKTSCFDIFRNPRYAFEIRLLDKVIHDFIQYQISSQLSLKSKNLIPELERLRHMCELGVMDERMVNGTIVPKLTTDLHESDMMLQQISPDGMFSGAFDKTPTCNYSGLGKPDFVVGLEKYFNLKTFCSREGCPCLGCKVWRVLAKQLCQWLSAMGHWLKKLKCQVLAKTISFSSESQCLQISGPRKSHWRHSLRDSSPRKLHRRFSLSGSKLTTGKEKIRTGVSILNPGKPRWRLSLSDLTTAMEKSKSRMMFSICIP